MPVTEMIVATSVGLFFLLGFLFLVRLIQAWMLHRTLRDAIKKDSPHVGMLADRVGLDDRPRAGAGNDDRIGLVLVAVGIALAGFSLVVNDLEWLRYGLGSALFPTLVGAALLIRHRLQSRSAEPDVAAGA